MNSSSRPIPRGTWWPILKNRVPGAPEGFWGKNMPERISTYSPPRHQDTKEGFLDWQKPQTTDLGFDRVSGFWDRMGNFLVAWCLGGGKVSFLSEFCLAMCGMVLGLSPAFSGTLEFSS